MYKIIVLVIGILIISGCKKKGCTNPKAENYSEESKKDDGSCVFKETEEVATTIIPFKGVWHRQFEAGTGSGNWHTAKYAVYEDSIRYTLSGSVGQANYVLLRDTFLLENNRFIGHTPDNIFYLVFTKYITNDSIFLYKEIIPNFEDGLSKEVPSDTTSQNHGWSYYVGE